MTHTFVARVALDQTAIQDPANKARWERLSAAGWSVVHLSETAAVATTGAAKHLALDGWTVTGLAYLDDRLAAQDRLRAEGVTDVSGCDLELILRLRIALGPGFATDLAGSFSVVFSAAQSGEIEAYRDHFGLYPAYFVTHDGHLTCSSDLRAALHVSGIDLTIDAVRVADFVRGEDIDLNRTAFQGLTRLAPGHALVLKDGSPEVSRYWELHPPALQDGRNAVEEMREVLKVAGAAPVQSGGEVGAMLSGGLDSSSLAGLAARASDKPLKTVSFVYGADKAYDETDFIDAATETFGSVAHKIPVAGPPDLGALASNIDEQMDLFLALGLPKSRPIYDEARALGIEVLIDGHGGDEVISHGYGRLVELAATRKFRELLREGRGAAKVHGVPLLALYAGHIARYSGMRPGNLLRRVLLKLARVLMARAAIGGWAAGPISLIAPALREEVRAEERYRPDANLTTKADFQQAERLSHVQALTDPLMAHSFEVLHRAATAAGILPRYPFFDERVVMLSLALPSDVKLRNGRSRWILREAMEGILPDKIRLRPDKAEFGAELKESVTRYFAEKDASDFAAVERFVDVRQAEALRQAVLSEKITDVAATRALWRLAVLIQWVAAVARWQDEQSQGRLM